MARFSGVLSSQVGSRNMYLVHLSMHDVSKIRVLREGFSSAECVQQRHARLSPFPVSRCILSRALSADGFEETRCQNALRPLAPLEHAQTYSWCHYSRPAI
eukprot:6150823-Amphidinium_carterae.1